jgi:glycosyltransferase involved in cell wall biosynthesis
VHPAFDARIFHKEAKTLTKAGYHVVLIAQHSKEEVVDGVKILALPEPRNRLERMTKVVWKLFRLALKEKADVYHFHDPELIPIGLVLKFFGKKVIYDVHEDVPEQILSKDYIPKFLKKLVSGSFKIFENYSSKAFSFVITATDAIACKFLKRTSNVISVKNYISGEYAKTKAQSKISHNVLKVIFVGGIYRERGIIEGIKAMNLLSDLPLKFILYGSVDKKILSELKSLDMMERLDYQGIIPYTEVADRLKEADIGFICDYPLKRHMEGLPVKLFEYMAAGLASIASHFPLWKEIVEGNHCGICVDPASPEQMAEAMKYLYENPSERRRMGINGRKAILEEYNWEKEAQKLLNIYSRIFGDKNV